MQPSEILKQIKLCDLDEPFVFISYSSQDNQRVWADALRFQQMGYNVWLDEKNLDKTKPSWRDDALEAIRDFNCALLVYYVSRSSLVSQACFNELECTVEDTTQAIHNGPVKFIAVYKDVSEKRMSNFKKTMGIPIVNEVTGIEGLWGFGDGHETEGLVVTMDKLHYSESIANPVEYRKVTKVGWWLSSGDTLIIQREDTPISALVGPTTLGAPIKAFLQACIDQRS